MNTLRYPCCDAFPALAGRPVTHVFRGANEGGMRKRGPIWIRRSI